MSSSNENSNMKTTEIKISRFSHDSSRTITFYVVECEHPGVCVSALARSVGWGWGVQGGGWVG